VIKRLTQWRVREGMSREEALRYWREHHAPLVEKVPGVRRYVQNHCLTGVDGAEPSYAGLGEIWFDSRASAETALSTDEWAVVIEDAGTFMDMGSVSAAWAEEYDFAASG
jgi:uncharacterized protein (TIGR02118 family)